MRAYLDIGSFSARSLVVTQANELGHESDGAPLGLLDPWVFHRKCTGRGRGGFVNMEQAKIDLLSLSNQIMRKTGQAKVPMCSVLVRDHQTLREIREIVVEMYGRSVTASDLSYLQHNISLKVPPGYYLLHGIPVGYRIDDGELLQNPLDMAANRLCFYVFIIAVTETELQNYQRLLHHAQFPVKSYHYDVLAHGVAALRTTQQKHATVLEFGAMNTHVSFWQEGKPIFMHTIPLGMDSLTVALVRRMNCTTAEAERIKHEFGLNASQRPIRHKLSDNITEAQISSADFTQILLQEMDKILQPVFDVMTSSTEERFAKNYPHTIVLTGGACRMVGLRDYVQRFTDANVMVAEGGYLIEEKEAFMGCLGLLYLEQDDLGQSSLPQKVASGYTGRIARMWITLKEIFS